MSKEVEIVNTRLGVPCLGAGETGGVAVSLSPNSPRFVGGKAQNIRVNLAAPLPGVARNVRVIYQLFTTQGKALEKNETKNTKVFHGRYVKGSAEVSVPGNTSEDAVNGAALRVSLEYQTIDDGVYHPFWAGRTMVYYVNEVASRFKIDTDEIDGLHQTVTLTPPIKLRKGYPKFVPGQDNFVAVIEGQDDVKLEATADWNDKDHPGKAMLSLKFKNNDAKNAFFKIACKDETKLKISVSDTSDQSPSVEDKTVEIKKRLMAARIIDQYPSPPSIGPVRRKSQDTKLNN